jgi:hypothetical protein
MEKNVGQVEKKVEDSERRMEGIMLEEMRAKEAIKRNIVIYGMEEQERGTDKEKMEADLTECEKVYTVQQLEYELEKEISGSAGG